MLTLAAERDFIRRCDQRKPNSSESAAICHLPRAIRSGRGKGAHLWGQSLADCWTFVEVPPRGRETKH
jgi:hypothetical protein